MAYDVLIGRTVTGDVEVGVGLRLWPCSPASYSIHENSDLWASAASPSRPLPATIPVPETSLRCASTANRPRPSRLPAVVHQQFLAAGLGLTGRREHRFLA